jgi:hypothetical protein
MASRNPARFRPLFVLAPARSCSSVVVAMLGQHPQLYGFPELRLFRAARVGELLVDPPPGHGQPARVRAEGLLRALAQLHHGEQTPQSVRQAWRWLRQRERWDVAAVLDELLGLVEPLIGVEKSPETSLTDQALAGAAHAYPAARYLHLVRHPWATVASMIVTWGRLDYWRVPRDRAAQFCAAVWLAQHRRITEFGTRIGPGRFVRLRAEDIVNRPGDVLVALCRWLGIEDGPESQARMRAPERSPYASPGPVNATGGLDPSFLHRPGWRSVTLPASLATPASWALEQPTRDAVIDLARSFGYTDSGIGHRRWRGVSRYQWATASRMGGQDA